MKKIGGALVSLGLVGVLTCLLLELVPGDVTAARLGTGATVSSQASLREALGLHGNAAERGMRYFGSLLRLDLGRSLVDGRAVRDKIFERLPRTVSLAFAALVLAWAIALPLSLRRRRGVARVLASTYALPVPALCLGMLSLGASYGASLGATLCAALALQPLLVPRTQAQLARALDEALASDATRTLRAAGATHGRLVRAALRTQALRLLTLVALQLPALLSGAVLVEAMFGLPGLGLLALESLATRDVPTLLGLVLVGASLTIGCTLAVDLLSARLDPRLERA